MTFASVWAESKAAVEVATTEDLVSPPGFETRANAPIRRPARAGRNGWPGAGAGRRH